MCNDYSCRRERESLEKRRKAGWKMYFETRDMFLNHLFNSVVDNVIPTTVKNSLRNIIQQIPDWSQDNKCCICTEALKDCIYFLKCGHFVFHKNCLDTWKNTNNTCPVCRQTIDIFCEIEL